MTRIKILTFIFLLISAGAVAQQSSYEKAWVSFVVNDLDSARIYFNEAAKEEPNRPESLLMLSIIADIFNSEEEAFDYFIRFTETVDDINPYFSAYFHPQLIGFSGEKRTKSMVNYLTQLYQSGKMGLTERGNIAEILAFHYYHSNDMKKANEYFSAINSLTEWQIAGVFENISQSGFDKTFGPVGITSADSLFTDKFNNKVQWFKMIETRTGKWNDFVNHFYTDNSVIYAQTFCYSPVAQDIIMRVGTSGSLKTWVNDKLLFIEPNERNNGMDTYQFTAKLSKGYNRFLLQIGSSEIEKSNFMVRVSDTKNEFITNLSYSASYQDYVKDTGNFQSQQIPGTVEGYFCARIESEPKNLLNYILLINSLLAADKTTEATQVIKSAQKLAPDCTYLKIKQMEAYSRDDNNTLSTRTLEDIKNSDPENPLSMSFIFYDELKKENYEEAEKLLSKLIGKTGDNKLNLFKQISLANKQDKIENKYELIEAGYKKYPDDSYFVKEKYGNEITKTKNSKKAGKILTNYLTSNYSEEVMSTYAIHLAERGNVNAAMSCFETMLDNNPEKIGGYYSLGYLNFLLRDYYKAIAYYQKCQDFAPFVAGYYKAEGQCWEELANKEKVLQLYEKVLELDPTDYELRRTLRIIESQAPIFSNFDTPDIDKIIDSAANIVSEPGDGIIMLHIERQKVVYSGGASEEKNYRVFKVLNSDGIKKMKEYSINLSGNEHLILEKAEIIKPNKQRMPGEANYNHIVFTSLEVGDIIYVVYRIEKYDQFSAFAPYFNDFFYMNYYYPAKTLKYSLLIANDEHFNYSVTNGAIEPTIKEIDENYSLYTWYSNNVASLKYETKSPSFAEVAQGLHLSSYPDWKFFADWYNDVSAAKMQPDTIVKVTLRKILAGKEDANDSTKAQLIYQYIVSEIKYSSVSWRQSGLVPRKASEVITEQLGDCKDVSVLFVTLCNEAGLEANLVLVASRELGMNPAPLPEFIFDHCIAKVVIDGESYYVEPTQENLPFGALGYTTKGAFALEVGNHCYIQSEPYHLYPESRVLNTIKRESHISIEDDSVKFITKSEKAGLNALSMKNDYKNKSRSEQEKNMEESIAQDKSNVKLLNLEFDESLNLPGKQVDYSYGYSFNIDITKSKGFDILTVNFTDDLNYYNSLISLNQRNFPLELFSNIAYDDELSEVLNVEIPIDKTVENLPEDIHIQNDYFIFTLTYHIADGNVVMTRYFKTFKDRVSVEDYHDFKDAFSIVTKSDDQKLVLFDKLLSRN